MRFRQLGILLGLGLGLVNSQSVFSDMMLLSPSSTDPKVIALLGDLKAQAPEFFKLGGDSGEMVYIADPTQKVPPFFLSKELHLASYLSPVNYCPSLPAYQSRCPDGSALPSIEQLRVICNEYWDDKGLAAINDSTSPIWCQDLTHKLEFGGVSGLSRSANGRAAVRCALDYKKSPQGLIAEAAIRAHSDLVDQEIVLAQASIPVVQPRTHFIFINGETDAYRFYNNVRRGYETIASSGKNGLVFTANGKWKVPKNSNLLDLKLAGAPAFTAKELADGLPMYPPVTGPAEKFGDILAEVMATGPVAGDTLFVYITGHGHRSGTATLPTESGICLLNGFPSYEDLIRDLSLLPKELKIKLVTTSCFGGGIHALSRRLPNVCTASTTNFGETSWTGTGESEFNIGLWNRFLEKKGKVAFSDLMIAGFRRDESNVNVGRLSSFDFVDFVLKSGPYDPNWSHKDWLKRADLYRVNSKPEHQNFGEKGWNARKNLGYTGETAPDAFMGESVLSENVPDVDHVGHYNFGTATTDFYSLDQYEKLLQDVIVGALNLPLGVQTVFHQAIADMRKNGKWYAKTLHQYAFKFNGVKDPKMFSELMKQAHEELNAYFLNQRVFEKLERLEAFSKVASPKQKAKLIQLLQCEWESL